MHRHQARHKFVLEYLDQMCTFQCQRSYSIIEILKITVFKMTMWKVSLIVKKIQRKHHLNLQVPSNLQSLTVSFSILFICVAETLLFWFTLTALIALFSAAAGSCFLRRSSKTHFTLPAQWLVQTKHGTERGWTLDLLGTTIFKVPSICRCYCKSVLFPQFLPLLPSGKNYLQV